ncbi:MAG TPA: ABC transporter permease [Puia sp.]|nr:ABC transporter permease [Puia sp.]
MLRNYLKIAFRNLTKHKLYSIINIGGLSIGIGTCLLILLYVIHEHSYDNFHQHADRIYATRAKVKIGGDSLEFSGMGYSTAIEVKKFDPSVESALRVQKFYWKKAVQNPADPEKKFGEDQFIFADSNFFRFFSFQLKAGDPDRVLARPFTLVITEEAARKYFGNANPIGKTLRYDSAYTFEITGIVAQAPSNSSIRYDFIASMASQPSMKDGAELLKSQDIMYGNYDTYFRLQSGAQPGKVESTLLQLAKRNKDMKDIPARYLLTSLQNSHLLSEGEDDSDVRYLTIFPLVAGLILLLALINYMNLTTARASLRAKEIGIRKTNGATRSLIAQQFYVESALYALLSFGAGLLLFRIGLPYFYRLMDIHIDPSFIYQPRVLVFFAGLLLVTIFIAGTYPSMVLSSYNPVAVLYGRMSRQKGGVGLRKFLTVLQFSVSIVLIVSSILISRQLYFLRHTDTGIKRDHIVSISFEEAIGRHYTAFKKEVGSLPGVSGVAISTSELYVGYNIVQVGLPGGDKNVSSVSLLVDESFISLLGMQWKFAPTDPYFYAKARQVVINESAIAKFQLPPDPVGKQISLGGEAPHTVAGVVKDFNYTSLHSKIDALCLIILGDPKKRESILTGHLMVKIGPGVNLPTMMEKIKKLYERYDPTHPFDYSFLDEDFNMRYKAEDNLAGILNVFTGLTVLIACLGLFGLAAFSAAQKTKEIGIRKVLGATVQSLVLLLTRDFIRLVLVAIVVAVPVAWYFMHKWLESFAYRIPVGWTVFLLAGSGAILIALVTVSWEALRTAMANPVKSLKAE